MKKSPGIKVTIELRNESGQRALGEKRVCELAVAALRSAGQCRGRYGFSLLFTGDRVIKGLNRRYLGRRRRTDVLAFPDAPFPRGKAGEEGDERQLGDIAISVQRAAVQAAEYRWSVPRELELLVVHGLLHLLGYDHETDEGEMEALQEAVIKEEVRRKK